VKSSEPSAVRRGTSFVALILMALSALGIGFVRPALAARFQRLKVLADVYPFGSPDQMIVASLGYRSALADLVFVHVRIAYGLHFEEKRRFEFVGAYLDAINALDPKFRDPYVRADTFLTLGPMPARLEDYVKAREVFARGRKEFPYDTELWSASGQFLAYLAPGSLPTREMKDAWRLEGAKVLDRACELANDNQNVPYQCITAANLFANAGEREAAIGSLQRLLAVNDDPEIERIALGYLGRHLDERAREREELRKGAFRVVWKADLPFVTKNLMLAVGPRTDTARCAGPGHSNDLSCITSWREWARLSEPAD